MKNNKDNRDMVKGARRFFVTALLVSVMAVVSVMPVIMMLSEANAGVPVITGDESSEIKPLPLKMQMPDDAEIETSRDVRL